MKSKDRILEEMNNITNVMLGQDEPASLYRLQGQYAALAWVLEEEESK